VRVGVNTLFRGRAVGMGRYTDALFALESERLPVESIAPRRSGGPWRKLLFEQLGAPRAARRMGVDLLHYPYFAAPVAATVPVIATIHDLVPLLLPAYRGSPFVRAYTFLQARACARARLILTDSAASMRDILRHLGIPAARVRVVPLGIDDRYHPRDDATVREFRRVAGLPERYIVYAGGLDVRKNVHGLLRGYARARREHDLRVDLAVTGDPDRGGPLFPAIREEVERLGIGAHVCLLGAVDDRTLPVLLAAATLAAYPSMYEGFGLPVLEAMASGVPVICSDRSALPEVAGDVALLFDPTDEGAIAAALARGVEDRQFRERAREEGVARARTFTWERTRRLTGAAYRDALGET